LKKIFIFFSKKAKVFFEKYDNVFEKDFECLNGMLKVRIFKEKDGRKMRRN